MPELRPCPACARHVKATESNCPFCSASLADPFGAAEAARDGSAPKGPLTRAAMLFAGAAVGLACSSTDTATNDGGMIAMYGPAPIDAGADATNDDSGAVVMYGPAPIDAGADTKSDDGGIIAMYGPAPVDSGSDADSG